MKEIITTIKRLLWLGQKIGRKNKTLFIAALIAVAVTSIITAYIPQAIGNLVDNFSQEHFPVMGIITIGILYLFTEIFTYFRKFFVERAATDAWNKLTCLNIDRLLHIDLGWLKNQELGGLNARFQRSINGAIKLLKISFMDLIPAFLMMIFSVVIAVKNSAVIGLIITMVIPIAFFIINRQIRSQKGIRISLNRAIETIQAKLIEVLTGIETIRAAGNEKVQLQKLGTYSEDIRNKEFRHHQAMMRFDAFKGLNKAFWNIMVLVISLYFLKEEQITVGQVFTFLLLFGNVIKPLDDFHRFLDEAAEASILTSDFIEIMRIPQDKIFYANGKNLPDKYDSQILVEVNRFSFGYNGKIVINDITLEIEKGKFYGVVGESGCGKSTLIKTILGLDYGNGSLKFSGIDIKGISREKLTELIAYVPQRPFVITGSFRENILFGLKGDFTDDEIWEAAQKAKIDQLIKLSDNGLDSIISPSGNNISGGEAQRIALARLFLNRTAELIILDEGTSALDNSTENYVYKNLLKLTKSGKSVISIVHRLDTLRKADKIFVMDKGKIVEEGIFNDLLQKREKFWSLHNRQETKLLILEHNQSQC